MTIDLNESELSLIGRLEFDQAKLTHETRQTNGEVAYSLFQSLSQREAIPKQRVDWFCNENFNFGRLKGSRKDNFLRNAHSEEEMYRDSDFLEVLRYFIFGANLPKDIKVDFIEFYKRKGVSSLDNIFDFGNWARAKSAVLEMDKHDAADEFYKLSLDVGMYYKHARTVYDIVRR